MVDTVPCAAILQGPQRNRSSRPRVPQLVPPKLRPILINYFCDRYFRWLDRGDLQGVNHLKNIVRIAVELPDVRFWTPTRDKDTVQAVGPLPENLVVLVSATRVNGPPPRGWPQTSVVLPTWRPTVRSPAPPLPKVGSAAGAGRAGTRKSPRSRTRSSDSPLLRTRVVQNVERVMSRLTKIFRDRLVHPTTLVPVLRKGQQRLDRHPFVLHAQLVHVKFVVFQVQALVALLAQGRQHVVDVGDVSLFAPGYVFLFFCGMMVLQLIWVWMMVPETRGVPLEEIEHRLTGTRSPDAVVRAEGGVS
jgi:hypothetical protein